MRARGKTQPVLYGVPPIGASRYIALYVTQISWLLFGLVLLANAYWPSTCRPDNLFEIYACSARLPESKGWVEAVLMTWLWTTPFLVALEVTRRFRRHERR